MPITSGSRFIRLRTDFDEVLAKAMDAKGLMSYHEVDRAAGIPSSKDRLSNTVYRARRGTTTTSNDYVTALEHALGVRLRDNNQTNKHTKPKARTAWIEITSTSMQGTTCVDLISKDDVVNIATFTGSDSNARSEAQDIAHKWAAILKIDVDVMYLASFKNINHGDAQH